MFFFINLWLVNRNNYIFFICLQIFIFCAIIYLLFFRVNWFGQKFFRTKFLWETFFSANLFSATLFSAKLFQRNFFGQFSANACLTRKDIFNIDTSVTHCVQTLCTNFTELLCKMNHTAELFYGENLRGICVDSRYLI